MISDSQGTRCVLQVMKWMEFANNFPVDSTACTGALNSLNEELASKSVLVGNGLRLTEVDVIVYAVIHSSVVCLSAYAHIFCLNLQIVTSSHVCVSFPSSSNIILCILL